MGKLKNIIGNKYGRLTVIKMLDEKGNRGQIKYLCKCDCGKSHIVTGESLRSGKSKSCGCLKKDFIEKNKFKRNMDRENAYMKLCIIQLIEALQDNKETKVIKDYLVDVVDGVYGNTLGDNKEDYFSKLTKECD